MESNSKKIDAIVTRESGWIKDATQRQNTESWLDVSFSIALRILRVLRERNMTQKDLADKMKVTPQYINKLVKGTENLSLETILALNKALGIDLSNEISKYQASIDASGVFTVGGIQMKYKSFASGISAVKLKSSLIEKNISTPYKKGFDVYSAKREYCDQMIAA